mmetsp:Transcript_24091/g.59551  ORF Transcript_24091/g.59551 Transcript_24091/m.59551 type:complete len:85 (-) Transcript_24091:1280-1534(-)
MNEHTEVHTSTSIMPGAGAMHRRTDAQTSHNKQGVACSQQSKTATRDKYIITPPTNECVAMHSLQCTDADDITHTNTQVWCVLY